MLQRVVSIEEQEENEGSQNGASPGGEEDEWGFLNVSGLAQTSHIHGAKAHRTSQLEHSVFRGGAVAADQDLGARGR